MANEGLIKNKNVTITLRDNEEYVIKPLTINELIEIWPIIVKLENNKEDVSVELLEDMKKLVFKALRGKVDEEKIGDLVDMVDLQVIVGAVVGQNASKLA